MRIALAIIMTSFVVAVHSRPLSTTTLMTASRDSLHLVPLESGFDGLAIRFSQFPANQTINTILELKYSHGLWETTKYSWGFRAKNETKRFLFFSWQKNTIEPVHTRQMIITEDNVEIVVNDLLSKGIASINGQSTLGLPADTSTYDRVTYQLEYAEPGCYHTASFTSPEALDRSFVEVRTFIELIVLFEGKFDVIE